MYNWSKAAGTLYIRGLPGEIMENPESRDLVLSLENGPPGITIRLIRFSGPAWACGIEACAFEGVPARITSPARTIVDCFRFERLIGREAAMDAARDSLWNRKVTVDALDRILAVLPSRRLGNVLDTIDL